VRNAAFCVGYTHKPSSSVALSFSAQENKPTSLKSNCTSKPALLLNVFLILAQSGGPPLQKDQPYTRRLVAPPLPVNFFVLIYLSAHRPFVFFLFLQSSVLDLILRAYSMAIQEIGATAQSG
jgi:hypothetical protein